MYSVRGRMVLEEQRKRRRERCTYLLRHIVIHIVILERNGKLVLTQNFDFPVSHMSQYESEHCQ